MLGTTGKPLPVCRCWQRALPPSGHRALNPQHLHHPLQSLAQESSAQVQETLAEDALSLWTQSSVLPAPTPPPPVSGPGKLCPSAGDIGRGCSLPVDTELCTPSTRTAPSSLWPPWHHRTGRDQKRLSCPDSWLCSQLCPAEPKDDSQVLTSCVRKA